MIIRKIEGIDYHVISPALYRMVELPVEIRFHETGVWYVWVEKDTDKTVPYKSVEDAAASIAYACRVLQPCPLDAITT